MQLAMHTVRLAFLSLALPSAQSATTVLVMRHCARSTGDAEVIQSPGTPFSSDDSYVEQPWLVFPVASMSCLPRGADIIEGEGKWMHEHGNLPKPITAVSDEMERDVETGMRFMKGLQAEFSKDSFVLDKRVFSAQFAMHTPKCMETITKPPGIAASLQAAFQENPELEAQRAEAMARLFEITGQGVGGDWSKVPCTVNMSTGPPQLQATGSCQVAYVASERLLMEWAGGMQAGWGKVKQPELELPNLHRLTSYYFHAVYGNQFIASRLGAEIARNVLNELNDGTNGTKIFVGHDLDLASLSGIFGLRWDASPFGVNDSLPGAILRLDLDTSDASIQASYNFVPSFVDSLGKMKSVPADFGLGAGNKASLAIMMDLFEKNTIPECTDTPHHGKDSGLAKYMIDATGVAFF